MEPGALVASMLYYWMPGAALRHRGRAQAARRFLGPVPPRRPAHDRALLADRGRGRGGRRRAAGRPGPGDPGVGHRAPGRRRAGVQLPVRRAWTPASSPCWPTRPIRASTPTRSRSGPRTSGSRPCPTTRSTPGRSRPSSASSCTRSRSRRTWSACCPGSWTCWTSRSATRPRSTPCSCARRPATAGSRWCCPGWAPTSCSAATASTWPASWPATTAGCPACARAAVRAGVGALPVSAGRPRAALPCAGPSAS